MISSGKLWKKAKLYQTAKAKRKQRRPNPLRDKRLRREWKAFLLTNPSQAEQLKAWRKLIAEAKRRAKPNRPE